MKRRFPAFVLCLLLICSVFIPISLGSNVKNIPYQPVSNILRNSIYVDDNNTEGPWDGTQEHPFQFIQDGINVSSSGDTVLVASGTYLEFIHLGKSIKLKGENRDTTIIDAQELDDVVDIFADRVSVTGFTIKNAGDINGDIWTAEAGILIRSSFNSVYDNIICYNTRAIYIHSSEGIMGFNTIYNNIITHNGDGIGIHDFSFYNKIRNNIIENATGNTGYGEGAHGIFIGGSFNTISGNIIRNNNVGILIGMTHIFNTISGNYITNNIGSGVYLYNVISIDFINENNFVDNGKNGYFRNPFFIPPFCMWNKNYWDDWGGSGSYRINGILVRWIDVFEYKEYPWHQFDRNPASEPYDIEV